MTAHTVTKRAHRKQLHAQRDRLPRLRSDLEIFTPEGDVRSDREQLLHLAAGAQLEAVEARLHATEVALDRLETGVLGVRRRDPAGASRSAAGCPSLCAMLREVAPLRLNLSKDWVVPGSSTSLIATRGDPQACAHPLRGRAAQSK